MENRGLDKNWGKMQAFYVINAINVKLDGQSITGEPMEKFSIWQLLWKEELENSKK